MSVTPRNDLPERACGLVLHRWCGALCCREGGVELLLGRESIERAIDGLSSQVLVEEVQHRRPVFSCKGVAVAGEVHAKAFRRAKQRIGRPGAEDRLPHSFRQRDRVGIAFEGDERPWRRERQEPVLIERQLLPLAAELLQVR